MALPTATFQENIADGWRVAVVTQTGSTNADLLRLAVEGLPGRSVLMARHQTAGRGRLDRRWEAPAGANLLVSILFRPSDDRSTASDPQMLVHQVAVAAVHACELVAGVHPELKWPNDVLLDGEKLAGVLAEAVPGPAAGGPPAVVVGIGLNIGWAPEGAARLGDGIDPLQVLTALLRAIDDLDEPERMWLEYRRRLATLGRRVRIDLGSEVVEGVAVDVERDGRLLVDTDDGRRTAITVGDVVHLRNGS